MTLAQWDVESSLDVVDVTGRGTLAKSDSRFIEIDLLSLC